jgi:hypothetical protein
VPWYRLNVPIVHDQGSFTMSLRSMPLIVLAFILYNVVVMLGGGVEPEVVMAKELFGIPLLQGRISMTWGSIIILFTMLLLFIELIKSTFTSTSAMVDHGLSMLVFIACLVELLVAKQAASATFFILMVATLIDVVAGFMIGMRTARRDLNIGTDN